MKKIFSLLFAVVMALSFGGSAFACSVNSKPIRPAAVDKSNEESKLDIKLISDTHVGADGTDKTLEEGLKMMQKEADTTDALIVAGDLTDDGSEELIKLFYDIIIKNSPVEMSKIILATGNHDMGQTQPSYERRANFITYNRNSGVADSEKCYYSKEINGYKFIVMADEGNGSNTAEISDEQIEFVRQEVEDGTKDGKPVFVICHWPMYYTHGAEILWPIVEGGTLFKKTTTKLIDAIDDYDNVFYINGHLHAGLNGTFTKTIFNASCVEEINGITLINAPSFGKENRFGVKTAGTGFEVNVYDDSVLFAGRNYLTGEYYTKYTYDIPLVAA